MKRNFLKAISGAGLAILMTALTAQVWVSAQESGAESEVKNSAVQNLPGREIEGVWNVQVTIRNCQTGAPLRTIPAMNSYMQGGIVQETAAGQSPALRSPGHGTWVHQSNRRYISTLQFFRFAADGTYLGTQKALRYIDVGYESYKATAYVYLYDINGNLTGTGCATEEGTPFF